MAQNPVSDSAARTRKHQNSGELRSYLLFLLKFALAVLLVRSLLISSFSIPSESMQPRLLVGDYLIANKFAYGWSRYSWPLDPPLPGGRVMASLPERGDVVVFRAPPENVENWIKRVIGLPGDRIQVIDGILFLNGRAVRRTRLADAIIPVTENMVEAAQGSPCYQEAFETMHQGAAACRYPQFRETLPNGRSYVVLDLILGDADTTGVYEVPAGHVFLMGDNRDRSLDSRFPADGSGGIGIVPADNLVGKAWFTPLSVDGSARWYNPISWFTAIRWHRIGETF